MNLLNNLNIQIKRIQHKNLRDYSAKEIKKNYMPFFNHKNFQVFEESLLETKHDFPNDIIKDCDMIPQGIAIVKETLMITAYEHAHKHNSILYLKDLSSGETKYLTLPNKAHSGGITTHNGLIDRKSVV